MSVLKRFGMWRELLFMVLWPAPLMLIAAEGVRPLTLQYVVAFLLAAIANIVVFGWQPRDRLDVVGEAKAYLDVL